MYFSLLVCSERINYHKNKISLLLPPTLPNSTLKAEGRAQLDMLSNPCFLRAYQY